MKALKSDNIGSVIAHDYLKSPRPINTRALSNSIANRTAQLNGSVERFTDVNVSADIRKGKRNKIFRNFHTKTSELRSKLVLKE